MSPFFLFFHPREQPLSGKIHPRPKISQAREGQKEAGFLMLYLHISQLTHTQSYTSSHVPSIPQRRRFRLAARPLRHCNGGPAALQQRPRCRTKAASPRPREGLMGTKREFFRTKSAIRKLAESPPWKSRKAVTGP